MIIIVLKFTFLEVHTIKNISLQVTLRDLKNLLSKLSYGGQTTDASIKAILKKADKTSSGAITFDVSYIIL